VHQWAQAQVPGVPLFVVGHSFGGQIVGLSPNTSVRGTLLIAAQSGYWKNWDGPKRWGMATLWHVVFPAIGGTLGYIPGWTGIGEDLPAGAASEWARWGRHPEYLFAHKTQASDGFAAYPGRIRSISIEDDAYAPRRSVEDLGRRFPVERYSHQHLVPADDGLAKIGHFGWFRKSSNLLWKQGLHWMEQCL